jgi:uncharacterized paraquat-inducible protein A
MCFLLPPARLHVKTRQRILVFVDAVGKMSLMDAFFMFIAEGALAVAWKESGTAGGRVEIQTIPGTGLISLFGATILCLVFGHLVLLIHNLEQNQHATEAGADAGSFALRRSVSRKKRIFVDAILVIALVLLPCCFAFPVLTMHIGGGFKTLFELLDQQTDITLTIFNILLCDMRLSGPSMYESEGWKLLLTGCAIIFGVLLPVLWAIELAVLWAAPLSTAKRFWGLCMIHTARAWAALDIVFASLVISYFQMPLFMKAVTTDQNQAFTHICSAIHDQFGINCFEVSISPEAGTAYMGVVSALLLLASIIISGEASRNLKHGAEQLTEPFVV